MVLNAARGFSGGPMSDIDYGQAAGGSAWVESTGGQLVVTQPSTGTRSISIAQGVCDAYGIRVINDAPLSQALTAPGSGGAWYLIAIRRDWGTKLMSLQVLPGPTTGSTTAPTAPPTAVPATYQNAPGTQFDQPLAWVWASSASTTLTMFDSRITENGARGLHAPTLWAMMMANQTILRDGAIISVGQHYLPSGGNHFYSLWQRSGGTQSGYLRAIGDICVNDGAVAGAGGAALAPGQQSASMADIKALAAVGFLPNIALIDKGTRVYEQNSQSTWRWDNALASFKAFDWAYVPNGFSAANGASTDTNGGDSAVHIVGGVVLMEFNLYRAAGVGTNTAYAYLIAGLVPRNGSVCGGSIVGPGGQGAATFYISAADGSLVLTGSSGVSSPTALRGTAMFRPF